eukprot:3934328-Rhodomonas_salina.1
MIPLVAVENETEPSKAWTAVDVEGEKETTPSLPPIEGAPNRLKNRMIANMMKNKAEAPAETAGAENVSPFGGGAGATPFSWDVLLDKTGIAENKDH